MKYLEKVFLASLKKSCCNNKLEIKVIIVECHLGSGCQFILMCRCPRRNKPSLVQFPWSKVNIVLSCLRCSPAGLS